jgi:hypothetical protein
MARRVGKCINGCSSEQELVAHGTCYNETHPDRNRTGPGLFRVHAFVFTPALQEPKPGSRIWGTLPPLPLRVQTHR